MKEQNKKPKNWISIRVKPEEYSAIYQLYSKTTCNKLSEYVRMVLLREPITVLYRNQSSDEILTALNQIKNELSAIGNNFNQSIKALHSMRHFQEVNTWAMLNESSKQILFQDRCNPLIVRSINSITDAASASRAIMLGLNQKWIEQQGDFWIESSINFVTALIWYLRLYKDGIYCTLPHVIELAQVEFDKLFSILRAEPTLEALVSPFIKEYLEDAGKQLIGQISGAAIALGTLSTEKLYYVLSGDDFTMNINDPEHPKIVCIANNPQVSNIYSAVISLYLNNLQSY